MRLGFGLMNMSWRNVIYHPLLACNRVVRHVESLVMALLYPVIPRYFTDLSKHLLQLPAAGSINKEDFLWGEGGLGFEFRA
jgi:hypothetical protein